MTQFSPELVERSEFLRHHGWAETPRGWVKVGGFCAPLDTDGAMKIQAILDEIESEGRGKA